MDVSGPGPFFQSACPHCDKALRVRTDPPTPTAAGDLVLDTEPLRVAVRLHLRHGCEAHPHEDDEPT